MAAAKTLEDVQVITRGEHDSERRNQTSQEKRAARNSRVHFGDFEDVDTSALPTLENKPLLVDSMKEEVHKTVIAYFGILQEAHRYEVKFGIPFEEIKTYVLARDEKLEVKTQPGNSRLMKMYWEDQENIGLVLQLIMELEIHSGITFEDQLTFRSEAFPHRFIHVRIAAQVLGKGQGTPTLKYGIKCLGHCRTDSPPGSPGVMRTDREKVSSSSGPQSCT